MSTGIPRPRTASFSLHISTSTVHSSGFTSSSVTNSPGNLGRVPIDARVVLSKRRSGYVRYVGKLANEAGEWYGVALDEATGDHDGHWRGIAYFHCAPNHGVFVRRKEIFYVKEQPGYVKSPPSPVTQDTSEEGDTFPTTASDSSHDSHDTVNEAAVSPPSTKPTSALQRTFKSFLLQKTPSKSGQNLLGSGPTTSPTASPTRRTPTRASMIPPPAIATSTTTKFPARHQSIAIHPLPVTPTTSITPVDNVETRIPSRSSLFEAADEFADLTNALADQNNTSNSPNTVPPPTPPSLPLPPQIDVEPQAISSRESSPTSSPSRRPSIDRRHSTFAFGSPTTTFTPSSNAMRVVELEKEIVTMRTNHENVVAVLRATNKQHAANVLELRAQVSALADGNTYLQRQLSLKSAQLQELRQAERTVAHDRSDLETKLDERDAKIQELEREIATLKTQMEMVVREKESVLVHLQREFQAKQQRDREQIKRLREDVVSLCNERNALQSDLHDAKESLFF